MRTAKKIATEIATPLFFLATLGNNGFLNIFTAIFAKHGYFFLPRTVGKKTKKRTGRASENAAKEDLGEEGEAGCTIPKRLEKPEVLLKKKVKEEQEPVEKRQKMWKLIRQTGLAIELPEDSEHSEVSKHEDSVVKKDTKKDKRLMEAFTPQKKQKDRAIDKRPVLVF